MHHRRPGPSRRPGYRRRGTPKRNRSRTALAVNDEHNSTAVNDGHESPAATLSRTPMLGDQPGDVRTAYPERNPGWPKGAEADRPTESHSGPPTLLGPPGKGQLRLSRGPAPEYLLEPGGSPYFHYTSTGGARPSVVKKGASKAFKAIIEILSIGTGLE
ncbi:hypothetical protein OCS_04217 [Ophiocordyceps sinensis CO18]|uniref:Uncharacterized protein n=1 Tax=Ophiocordyceps sinensis (strain Co18 / CGMCC 3.14243) TaxID=911162 RepID=T5ADZ5_OPHSC|nr:hypothetical protein OCS_04217 [Ophiocordyceps sinensis CO18]